MENDEAAEPHLWAALRSQQPDQGSESPDFGGDASGSGRDASGLSDAGGNTGFSVQSPTDLSYRFERLAATRGGGLRPNQNDDIGPGRGDHPDSAEPMSGKMCSS